MGVRLRSEFKSDKGNDYKIDIIDAQYIGTIREFTVDSNGFALIYEGEGDERYKAIKGSYVEINVDITYNGVSDFDDAFVNALIARSDTTDFSVKIYKNNNLYWAGSVDTNGITREDAAPYTFKLSASDGLAQLKDIDYTTQRGTKTFIQHIKDILVSNSRIVQLYNDNDELFRTLIKWYNNEHPSNSIDPLNESRVSNAAFYELDDSVVGKYNAITAYDVLENILEGFGARIYQSYGSYNIVQVNEVKDDTPVFYRYSKLGSLLGTTSYFWNRSVENIQGEDGFRMATPSSFYYPTLGRVESEFIHNGIYNILEYPDANADGERYTDGVLFPLGKDVDEEVSINDNTVFNIKGFIPIQIKNNTNTNINSFYVKIYLEIYGERVGFGNYINLKRNSTTNWNAQWVIASVLNSQHYEMGDGGTHTVSSNNIKSFTVPIDITTPVVPNNVQYSNLHFKIKRIEFRSNGTVGGGSTAGQLIGSNNNFSIVQIPYNGDLDSSNAGDIIYKYTGEEFSIQPIVNEIELPESDVFEVVNGNVDISDNYVTTPILFGDYLLTGNPHQIEIFNGTEWLPSNPNWGYDSTSGNANIAALRVNEIIGGQRKPTEKYSATIYHSDFNPFDRLSFDSKVFAFNGGKFIANVDEWVGEWFIVEESITTGLTPSGTYDGSLTGITASTGRVIGPSDGDIEDVGTDPSDLGIIVTVIATGGTSGSTISQVELSGSGYTFDLDVGSELELYNPNTGSYQTVVLSSGYTEGDTTVYFQDTVLIDDYNFGSYVVIGQSYDINEIERIKSTTIEGIDGVEVVGENKVTGGTITLKHSNTSNYGGITVAEDGNVIKSLTFDDYGHVKTGSTYDLKSVFYTENEVDNLISEALSGFTASDFIKSTEDDSIDATIVTTWLDNAEINLGTGNDLRLYHNGTDNIIRVDSGHLNIDQHTSNEIQIRHYNGSSFESLATFIPSGATRLYHNNNLRIETDSSGATIYDDLTVIGSLTVGGGSTIISADTVTTSDNIIILNNGEVAAGVSNITAGVKIDRGTLTDYLFVFDEITDSFRVGVDGDLQAVATREDNPIDTGVPFYNDVEYRFDTSNGLTYTSYQLNVGYFGNNTGQLRLDSDTNNYLLIDGDGYYNAVSSSHKFNVNSTNIFSVTSTGIKSLLNTLADYLYTDSSGNVINGTWSNVNLSELTDDITSAVTLQTVTDNGSYTTNSISIGTTNVVEPLRVYGSDSLISRFANTQHSNINSGIRIQNERLSGDIDYFDLYVNAENGFAGLGFNTSGANLPIGSTNNANAGLWIDVNNNLYVGNVDNVSSISTGVLVWNSTGNKIEYITGANLLSDIGAADTGISGITLQQVTDNGNTTTNNLLSTGYVQGAYFVGVNDTQYTLEPDSTSYLHSMYISNSATVNGFIQLEEKYIYAIDGVTGGEFYFSTNGNSWIEKNNFGLGTKSPTSTLDVNGTVRFRLHTSNDYLYTDSSGNVSGGTWSSVNLSDLTDDVSSGYTLQFVTDNGNTTSNNVVITNGGNAAYNITQADADTSLILGTNGTSDRGYIKLWGNIAGDYGVIQMTTNNLHLDSDIGGKTYINFYANTDVIIGNSGSKLGIGTASPIRDLHINSATPIIRLQDNNSSGDPATGYFEWADSAGTRLGYLGYGTTSNSNLYIENETAGGSVGIYANSVAHTFFEPDGSVAFSNYGVGTFTGTATQRLGVDASGNVIEIPIGAGAIDGIGTTNYLPKWTDSNTLGNSIITDNGSLITVDGSIYLNGTDLRLLGSSSMIRSDNEISFLTTGGGAQIGKFKGIQVSTSYVGTVPTEGILFGTDTLLYKHTTNTLRTEGALIVDGNVGIGTTSPSHKLQIGEGTIGGTEISFDVSDITYAKIGNYYSSGDVLSLESFGNVQVVIDTLDNSTGNSFAVRGNGNSSASTTYLTVLDTGNVGIGTASPLGTLDVNGDIYLEGRPALDSDGTHTYLKSQSSTIYFQTSVATTAGRFNGTNLIVVGGGTFGNDVEVEGSSNGYILESPNGTRFRVKIDNDGNLISESI